MTPRKPVTDPDDRTDEEIKLAIERRTGIQSRDITLIIPDNWRDIGTFWASENRHGEWCVDGPDILVTECGEDITIVVHEEELW